MMQHLIIDGDAVDLAKVADNAALQRLNTGGYVSWCVKRKLHDINTCTFAHAAPGYVLADRSVEQVSRFVQNKAVEDVETFARILSVCLTPYPHDIQACTFLHFLRTPPAVPPATVTVDGIPTPVASLEPSKGLEYLIQEQDMGGTTCTNFHPLHVPRDCYYIHRKDKDAQHPAARRLPPKVAFAPPDYDLGAPDGTRVAMTRADFYEEFISNVPGRKMLWDACVDVDRREKAKNVIDTNWGKLPFRLDLLWEWALMDQARPNWDRNPMWGCLFYNSYGSCTPTSGRSHRPETHHCYACGGLDHGVRGTISDATEDSCAKCTEFNKIVTGLANTTQTSFDMIAQFIGLRPGSLPDTIAVRVMPKPRLLTATAVGHESPVAPARSAGAPVQAWAQPALKVTEPTVRPNLPVAESCEVSRGYDSRSLDARVRDVLPRGSQVKHQEMLFSTSPETDAEKSKQPQIWWCECLECKLPGTYRHPVFHGAMVQRQLVSSQLVSRPVGIVVKLFAAGEVEQYHQELMTYEVLDQCSPRPCAPLVKSGEHLREGLRNAAEGAVAAEKKLYIALLKRDPLPSFLAAHTDNTEACLSVARELVRAVATCHHVPVYIGDLKPANTVVKKQEFQPDSFTVELIDFEGAYVVDLQSKAPTEFRTELWRRPFVEGTGATAHERHDLWALGMMVYEILATCTSLAPEVQENRRELWFDLLERSSDAEQASLHSVPLLVRDVGIQACIAVNESLTAEKVCERFRRATSKRSIDDDATEVFGVPFPTDANPLLVDLVCALIGASADKSERKSNGRVYAHFHEFINPPQKVSDVLRTHVALLELSQLMSLLNDLTEVEPQSSTYGVRLARNTIIHHEGEKPYNIIWKGKLRYLDRVRQVVVETDHSFPDQLVNLMRKKRDAAAAKGRSAAP